MDWGCYLGELAVPNPIERSVMKIHLISSDDPPKDGETVEALCKAQIMNARLAFIFDTSFQAAASLKSTEICSRCYGIKSEGKYLAGAVNGQEAMTEVA